MKELFDLMLKMWNELPESSKEKFTAFLAEENRLNTLAEYGRCPACRSEDRFQDGVEIICRDCGYIVEDYSSDND